MTEACEAVNLFLGIDMGVVCGQTPAARYRRACVHEHVRDGYLCAEHFEAAADCACQACWNLPGDQAHDCRVMIRPRSEATP